MLKHKAYKYRIYPNNQQTILINKTIGSTRYIFNHFLDKWNTQYKEIGKGLTYNQCSSFLPQMKNNPETEWLKEVDSMALQQSLRNLADSFDRFFKRQNNFPKFKSKKNNKQSYTTVMQKLYQNPEVSIVGNRIKIAKLGWVKFANSKQIQGRILNATISKSSSNKYYISVLCEEKVTLLPKKDSSIGIDLGITDFAILSNGDRINNNRFTHSMQNKLKREQRKLSKKKLIAREKNINLLDAKNYQKQRIKVAKLYEKVVNQRTDFLNKLSTKLINENQIICLEDLNVKGMMKNRRLSKAIADVSWSEFVRMLQYKAHWYGRTVIKINRWFPSSQICSDCRVNSGKKSLDIREWICDNCNTTHDRDVNAAKNILNEGLRTVGTTGLA